MVPSHPSRLSSKGSCPFKHFLIIPGKVNTISSGLPWHSIHWTLISTDVAMKCKYLLICLSPIRQEVSHEKGPWVIYSFHALCLEITCTWRWTILSTTVTTVTQTKSTNNVLGILQNKWVPNIPLSYIFYYSLYFINEKIQTHEGYVICPRPESWWGINTWWMTKQIDF